MSDIQYRVQLQRDRLKELEAIYRDGHLSVAEAREIFRLRNMELRRRADRAWRNRGDNAEQRRQYVRQWRVENPGC